MMTAHIEMEHAEAAAAWSMNSDVKTVTSSSTLSQNLQPQSQQNQNLPSLTTAFAQFLPSPSMMGGLRLGAAGIMSPLGPTPSQLRQAGLATSGSNPPQAGTSMIKGDKGRSPHVSNQICGGEAMEDIKPSLDELVQYVTSVAKPATGGLDGSGTGRGMGGGVSMSSPHGLAPERSSVISSLGYSSVTDCEGDMGDGTKDGSNASGETGAIKLASPDSQSHIPESSTPGLASKSPRSTDQEDHTSTSGGPCVDTRASTPNSADVLYSAIANMGREASIPRLPHRDERALAALGEDLKNYTTEFIVDCLVRESRLYRCEACNILFPHYSTYILHRGCHGNEGLYQCHFCQRTFNEKFGFLTHFMQCVDR